MEDIINSVEQYLVLIGPAVVSVVSMIATVITAIRKVKEGAQGALKETKALRGDLKGVAKVAQDSLKQAQETALNVKEGLKAERDELVNSLAAVKSATEEYRALIEAQSAQLKKIAQENTTLRNQVTTLLKERK